MERRTFVFIFMMTASMLLIQNWFAPPINGAPRELISHAVTPLQESKENTPLSYSPPREKPTPQSSLATNTQNHTRSEETFYILENSSFQVVFSSLGGAIAEVNLPLLSKNHPKSVVKATSFDRELASKKSVASLFPMRGAYVLNQELKREKVDPTRGGYYPLLRRNHTESTCYALQIVREDLASLPTDKNHYDLTHWDHKSITFSYEDAHRKIVKTFTLPDVEAAPYTLDCSISTEGDTRGLWLTSGVPEVELISGRYSPMLQYRLLQGAGESAKSSVEKISLPKTLSTFSSIQPDWLSNNNGFFSLILDPLSDHHTGFAVKRIEGTLAPTRLSLLGAHKHFPSQDYPAYLMSVPLSSHRSTKSFRFLALPLEKHILHQLDTTFVKDGYDPDYASCRTFHGWFSFISEPFAKILFLLMKGCYALTHSWGLSIIFLTFLLRLMLYPLNAWSMRSTVRMQEIAPLLSAIQEKYKKDPKKLQLETMKLYKEKGANPFSGCAPLLIQMPFLIGMFDLLKSTFSLRGASFIPGWIDNLTEPDVLFQWGTSLPFFGSQFHLLPFLLGGVMLIQSRLNTKKKDDGKPPSEQQSQQQAMGNVMAIVFTVMFYHFPSGLNLYWLSSTVLAILQQWYIKKRLQAPLAIK